MAPDKYTRDVQQGLMDLGRGAPDTVSAFSQLHSKAMAAGAISTATKELMALAISICERCEPCVGYHLERALAAGADAEQARETIGVAIAMGGGPAAVYGARAGALLDEKLAVAA